METSIKVSTVMCITTMDSIITVTKMEVMDMEVVSKCKVTKQWLTKWI